jgi:hypothetical protein
LSFAAERCRDCNLSQDPGAEPALAPDDAVDEVAYEVADWPVGSRLRLSAVLAERGVPWRWEPGLNLVVRESDDTTTEAVLDEIEAEEVENQGAATDGGDGEDDAEDAGYESDVDDGEDDDDDEQDDDEQDDDGEEDDDDGAVGQAAMADLFVAADRLIHDPESLEVAVDLDTAADVVESSPPPFGIDDATWSTIRQRAAAVRAALDAPEDDEAEDVGEDVDAVVSERAQALRDTIRPWV